MKRIESIDVLRGYEVCVSKGVLSADQMLYVRKGGLTIIVR